MKLFGIGSQWKSGDKEYHCVGFRRDEVGNWVAVDNFDGNWHLNEIEALFWVN